MKYVPFKGASEDSEAKSLISYIPLTKVELWTDKDFSKVIETPHILADKFNIVIQIYQPEFSDLYQLIHMLVVKARLNIVNRENPEMFLELQHGDTPITYCMSKLRQSLEDSIEQILCLCQRLD